MKAEHRLSIGYFENFHYHDPAILIWGDGNGLKILSERLLELCSTKNKVILLRDLPGVWTVHDAHIRLEIVKSSYGMIRSKTSSESKFLWGLSQSQANQFADLIKGVADSDSPGHNYLETGKKGETVVIVSQGEYSERFYEGIKT